VPGTFAYTPAAGTVLPAGVDQTLSMMFTPADPTSFTTASYEVAITVRKATPTITWPTPAAIGHGTALGATQLNASANVQGTFAYAPPAGTVLPIGVGQIVSVTFTPTEASNYTTVTTTRSITVVQPPAAFVSLTSSVPSPQSLGSSVVFTANASGGSGSYEYQFVLKSPAGAWSIVRAFGAANTWTWNTATGQTGPYVMQVWARNAGTTVAYDTWAGMNFTVAAGPATAVTVNSSVPSPQNTGALVTFNASASGTSGNYEYQFVLMNPQGIWSIVRPYSANSAWTWNTTNIPAGPYVLQVWARNAGTTVTYDTWKGLAFTIVASPATSVTLTSSVPSPQIAGAAVIFSASASGASGSYEYQFVLMNPQGAWSIVRPYSAVNTWTWNTASIPAGSYVLQVWARNAGTTVTYDAWKGLAFSISRTPVTAVTLSASAPSPQTGGAVITFSASASGTSGSYEYQFVLMNPQGAWSIVRPYSSTNSWTWNTASIPTGSYVLQVWARNAGTTVSYDTWKGLTFVITSAPAQ